MFNRWFILCTIIGIQAFAQSVGAQSDTQARPPRIILSHVEGTRSLGHDFTFSGNESFKDVSVTPLEQGRTIKIPTILSQKQAPSQIPRAMKVADLKESRMHSPQELLGYYVFKTPTKTNTPAFAGFPGGVGIELKTVGEDIKSMVAIVYVWAPDKQKDWQNGDGRYLLKNSREYIKLPNNESDPFSLMEANGGIAAYELDYRLDDTKKHIVMIGRDSVGSEKVLFRIGRLLDKEGIVLEVQTNAGPEYVFLMKKEEQALKVPPMQNRKGKK